MPSVPSPAKSPQGRGHRPQGIAAAPPIPATPGETQARWIMRALRGSISAGTTRNVLIALLLLSKGEAEVAAAQPLIATVANCTVDRCRSCLRELRELGDISVVEKSRGKRPQRYRFHLPGMGDPERRAG